MMDDAPYDPEEELDLIDEVHLPPDLDDDDDDEEFHHRDDDDLRGGKNANSLEC